MNFRMLFFFTITGIILLLSLAACGPTVSQPAAQPTVIVKPSFQEQLSPIPTTPTYRCGAWSSNNAPNPYSTIMIYARLTKDMQGVSNATAQAIVHFKSGDQSLDQQPTSDSGGYVFFILPLEGRQPLLVPATVDVTFNVEGKTISCQPAFFTPE
jgi:hypothetical protein